MNVFASGRAVEGPASFWRYDGKKAWISGIGTAVAVVIIGKNDRSG